MNIEDTIRDALHADAAELSPVGSGPDHARRRAFLRKRRAQSGVLAFGVAALAGGSLAVVDARSSGQAPRVNAQPTPQPAVTPELSWKTVDGTVSYDRAHFTTDDGVTYALSTAPGSKPSPTGVDPQELYATRDGVTWTHVSLGADPWVADLTASNGVLYALGTGPGAQDALTYKLSTSSDGGTRWDGSPLPIDFRKPASSIPLRLTTSAHVARSDNTTVVVANGVYNPDFSRVADLKDAAVRTTATGVEVLDYNACTTAAAAATRAAGVAGAAGIPGTACAPRVVSTHPWSEFGIADPAALQQLRVLTRDGGGDWQTVALPSGPGTSVQDVAATSKGFVLVESVQSTDGQGAEQLLSSTDGHTWNPLPSAGPGVDSLSISGDRIIGVDSQTSAIFVSNDAGTTWLTTANPAGLTPGSEPIEADGTTADVGPLGYAVVVRTGRKVAGGAAADPGKTPTTLSPVATMTDEHRYLLYSVDGASWKVTDLAADGAPAKSPVSTTSVGADHVDITYEVSVPVAEGAPAQWKLVTLVGTPKAS
jgi:hypothetical protein